MVMVMMIRRYDTYFQRFDISSFLFVFLYHSFTSFSLMYLLCIDIWMEDTYVHYGHDTLLQVILSVSVLV